MREGKILFLCAGGRAREPAGPSEVQSEGGKQGNPQESSLVLQSLSSGATYSYIFRVKNTKSSRKLFKSLSTFLSLAEKILCIRFSGTTNPNLLVPGAV